jgi:cation transport regulator ChaB
MPYSSTADLPDSVKKRYSGRCREVFMEVFNKTLKGHPDDEGRAFATAETAAKQCKASKSSEDHTVTLTAVKFAGDNELLLEGLAIPFGQIKGKDLDGEEFGADTDFCLDWYETRPLLYHHGLNKTVKTAVVGRQVDAEETDEGIWVKTELDKRSRWLSRVQKLVAANAVGFSSGAMAHLATATKSGHITRWPWVELSLTPTNAHPDAALAYAIKTATPFFSDDVEGGSEPEPYTDHGERVLADVKAFLDASDDRAEFRLKSGRELSTANRATLEELDKHLADYRKRIKELLDRTDPAKRDEAMKAIVDVEAAQLVRDLELAGYL